MQSFRRTPLPVHRRRRQPARWGLALGVAALLTAATAYGYVRPHLRATLQGMHTGEPAWLGDEALLAPRSLQELYGDLQFCPLWVADNGLSPAFAAGLATLLGAPRHGLDPGEYHAARLHELMRAIDTRPRATDLAEAELLLSDGLYGYGRHLSTGRVDPSRLHPAWLPVAGAADVGAALVALARGGSDDAFERALAPAQPVYWRTLAAAERLAEQATAGDWPTLAVDHTLRLGDRDAAVPLLRARLAASAGTGLGGRDPQLFDPSLGAAVLQFQRRHGLDPDGVVGPDTRVALQVPLAARRQQLLLTLERLRWLPRRWPGRNLVVNAADFYLEAWQDDAQVLEMRVIVGRQGHATPVFHQRLERVELNPYWKVPLTIAVRELLPKIRADCGYLAEHGFQLVTSYADSAEVLDPGAIDWGAVGSILLS